ncbi:MAG: phage tail tape measure protein, partial [Candidatus Riflebacteria bacterium]|nr:phage tail tape measure protein [Candidatus Riflebacteria bacterium]
MPSSGYRKQTMDFGEMSRDLQSAAASFTKMSAAAAGFVSLVGAFKTFELEVTRANSAIGGSAKVYKQLSDAARNFALVSKYSAGEAASSMVMLAQAGFDAQETIAAMPHVLQLAQASMENLDLVADTVASTIRTFNMSAEEASRVTNVFAASCVNSLATVNKLAFSFRQVGPVAAEMGMNIEETAAALDVLYNRGLRGEQAGTALRNILVRLIKPTQDTLNAFSLLGIGLKNADGSARGLQQILSDLKKANLDDAYLAKIFGREALAASKTLIAATTGEYDKMKDAITDTNTVARMANAQMNTLDGALKLIKNSLNEVGIILGQAVGPIIKQVSSYIQDFAIYLRTADSSTISLIKNLGSFVAILGSAKFGVGRLLTEMKSLALVGGKITSAFSALSSMLVFKQSGAGVMTLKNYADTLRMFEISQSGGTNWYTNVNEFYKSVNNGVGISMKAATEIKNLTTAQVAYMRAVIAGSAATKAFSTALKGLLVSSGKLLLVLAPLMLAFKMYDSYMKERERRQQLQSELFPELDYLDQKIKNLKLTVSNDLPALVNKYKEAMDLMSQAEETRQKASIQGVTVSDEGSTISKDTMLRLDKVASLMKEQLAKQGNFNEVDIRKLAAEIEAPFDLVETYLKGAKERLAQLAKEGKELSEDRRWLLVGRAGWDALQDYVRAAGNTIRGAQDQFNEAEKLSEQVVTDIIKSLQETNARLEWLIVKGTNKEQSDRIKKA